jgi:hypothetical protein
VKNWSNLPNQLILPVRPGSVGEQHDGYLGFEVNPKRTAAESEVSDRPG